MKAAFKKSPYDVILRDIAVNEPGDYEILLKVSACGVCGGDLGSSEEYQQFGHEIAGVVEKTGKCVRKIRPGDKIVAESGSFCGVCENCRNGRVDLCKNVCVGNFSGFAEYAVLSEKNAVPFDGITFKQAGIIEPLGVALDLVYTADIKLNDHVLIIGSGSIGLMALQLAKAMGAGKIFVAQHATSLRKLEVAKAFGADGIIYTDRQAIEDYPFPKGGVDKILVTAPPKTIPSAIKAANYGAVIAYIGFSEDSDITFNANAFHVKKLQLRSSFAAPGIYFPTAVDLIKAGTINTELLISHTFRLDEIAQMMKTVASDRASVVKCVMLAEES
jgi:Threonine dehydrogenase and related Zn-dependent dehydrogenases